MQAPVNFSEKQDVPSTTRLLRDYEWSGAIPMALVHLSVLGAIWTGVTIESIICCVVLYTVRMWAVTAGYHRYFSHRSFKTSRVFQFILAFLAQCSAQRGALWWSSFIMGSSSKVRSGWGCTLAGSGWIWYSHIGWLF